MNYIKREVKTLVQIVSRVRTPVQRVDVDWHEPPARSR
jgi:hypothetical protein